MIIGELSLQLEKYSKQSDFEIRPDLELSQIVGQPFRGNLDLLPQGGIVAIQDIRFPRPYTIYIIQIFVSDLSESEARKQKHQR